MQPGPVAPGDLPDFIAALRLAVHRDADPGDVAFWSGRLEAGRSLAVRDGGQIVATAGVVSRRLVVPGGEVPLAGVTAVGVRPTHRRRGLLTALMRRQLGDVRERGEEAVAALWASEGAIYGRFGYGLAALGAALEVDTRAVRVTAAPASRPDLREPAAARDALAAIHAAARPGRPGMLDRDERWWGVRLHDPEAERDGASALRAAVIDGRGYALYAVRSAFGLARPSSEVRVRELLATDPEAHAALWDFLLEMDLVSRVAYVLAPADEPLIHMVTEPQGVQTRLHETLWVRLVDVPRALRERAYGEPFGVALEVEDAFCPWNAGRWALRWDGAAAACAPTAAPADLAVTAADLGAVHLGGTTLADLARAGRVRELRPGTLAPASRAFRGDRLPWCPEIF